MISSAAPDSNFTACTMRRAAPWLDSALRRCCPGQRTPWGPHGSRRRSSACAPIGALGCRWRTESAGPAPQGPRRRLPQCRPPLRLPRAWAWPWAGPGCDPSEHSFRRRGPRVWAPENCWSAAQKRWCCCGPSEFSGNLNGKNQREKLGTGTTTTGSFRIMTWNPEHSRASGYILFIGLFIFFGGLSICILIKTATNLMTRQLGSQELARVLFWVSLLIFFHQFYVSIINEICVRSYVAFDQIIKSTLIASDSSHKLGLLFPSLGSCLFTYLHFQTNYTFYSNSEGGFGVYFFYFL